ncbi:hypothetical protein GQ44DRAFT_728030 [Phaeosphaeriaceae sp. PMI808]|nr:hypothetical protein GQ44DRAFT_728030 [Phaeosphaeriaceae sp. PMI808]
MWAEVNGERKKVACGPCIRGHRSSKCDHRDRVLVEVRKPGRPLSSCPHPSGSCSCERIVINYTIPKSSECACPSERTQPVTAVTGSSRIQKNRRKSTALNPASLEKAIRAGQDAETDTSSYTQTPTERSGSNEASPPSSASSTPRLRPSRTESVSSCCQPKPVPQLVQRPAQQGGCCSQKTQPMPEPLQVKTCCSSRNAQPNNAPNPQPQTFVARTFGQQFQFQLASQPPQYPSNMQPRISIPSSFPYSLSSPIYNHAAAAYQQSSPVPMSPGTNGPMSPNIASPQMGQQHAPEHNCHCGESCSCFGCAAHPNNATMMEYIRLMAQFQYNGGFGSLPPPLYDMPTYPHHPGYGAEAHQRPTQVMNFNPMNPGFPTPVKAQMNVHGSIGLGSSAWQQTPIIAPPVSEAQFHEPSSYITSTTNVEKPLNLKTNESDAESPCDSKEEETPTLSPSSYFWNEMVLPNCSDDTGTCQCGDGCECVGCLTHGGHNGVPLDAPAIGAQNTFPDFTTSTALNMNDTTGFLFDSSHPS